MSSSVVAACPAVRAGIHGSQPLSSLIREVTGCFQKGRSQALYGPLQHIVKDGVHFYGIHREQQIVKYAEGSMDVAETAKRYAVMKSHVLQSMKLDPRTSLIQVVGDSAPFSARGTAQTIEFLKEHISSDMVILYGYTGHSPQDGARCVNAATSDFSRERGLLNQTIGNLVGFHSPVALECWGCSGPELQHYFLVYGDDESKRETGTVFGDDVTTSDYISDCLLIAEGGIQSFRQACNFLLLGRPIIGISGLRSDKTRFGVTAEGAQKDYFSAIGFLTYIKENLDKVDPSTIDDAVLESWFDAYLSDHLLADPKRNDYDTKKKLLDDAWNLFKQQKLYTKIGLLNA